LAISLNGDSDTIACIAGGIAAAYYKVVPQKILEFTIGKLDEELLKVVLEFEEQYA
jgi:ADP-ribosylglycohydrolase